ncbi:hypothetical protein Tco_0144289 [Tanacetum coccineum]
MSTPKFAETHNLVAFLEKPEESNGFEGIIDFLNASSIKYALTVNPTVYESCIKQFWATTKAKTVNGERQIQALVDKKKVIITEKSVRSDLMLEDAEGTECLPNDVFANMKRPGKDFSGKATPLFQTMMVQAPKAMGEDSAAPTDSHSTPIITQPSSSKPQKKKSRRKQRKDSEKEIASLKKRVKQLEKRKKSRTSGLKRLRKVGSASRVESSNDVSLGAQEDASKQGRKIADLDADEEPIVNAAKTTRSIPVSAADPVPTAGEIKAAKPKVITTAATTIILAVASSRPKAKEFNTTSTSKEKGKAKMVEPKKPLKKKDQITLDEELALRLHDEEQAELERMQKDRVATRVVVEQQLK